MFLRASNTAMALRILQDAVFVLNTQKIKK